MTGGSLKIAANTLSISQAAMSKLIQSLEDDLGLQLFISKRGGLRVSDAGKAIFRQTEQLFGGVWRIADLADQLRNREAGRLRIAAMSMLAVEFLPSMIACFVADRQSVAIELDTFSSNEVVRLVRSRHYDVGIVMPPIDLDGVEVMKAYQLRCMCISPPMHRFGAVDTLSPEMMRGEKFISLAEGSLTRLRIDELFATRNVERELKLSARSPASVSSFVLNGAGISIVDPFTAAAHRKRGGGVHFFEPEIPSAVIWVRSTGSEVPGLLSDLQETFEHFVSPHLMTETVGLQER